jgi:hypothetical protein
MLIHIGFHKTASTALQEHVFGDPATGFVRWAEDRKLAHPYLVCHSPLAPIPDQARDELLGLDAAAKAGGKCLVVSHERLSGYYATGGFDSAAIARRMAEAFPEARILIVVREQRAMLESFYSQYVSDGGVLPFAKFMRPMPQTRLRAPGFDPDFLLYDRLVQLYRGLFGADRVLVLPFELLKARPGEYVRRIGDHCGLTIGEDRFAAGLPRTNERRSIILQELVRQLNRVQRSQLNPGGLVERLPVHRAANEISRRLSGTVHALTPGFVNRAILEGRRRRITQLAGSRYAASNSALERITGLALTEWGYDLPDADEAATAGGVTPVAG